MDEFNLIAYLCDQIQNYNNAILKDESPFTFTNRYKHEATEAACVLAHYGITVGEDTTDAA